MCRSTLSPPGGLIFKWTIYTTECVTGLRKLVQMRSRLLTAFIKQSLFKATNRHRCLRDVAAVVHPVRLEISI